MIDRESDAFCIEIRQWSNTRQLTELTISDDGVLKITAEAGTHIVLPHSLKARVLYITHDEKLEGNYGGRKFYYLLWQKYYWPDLAVDAYNTVHRCPTCEKNRIKLRRNISELKLFPASEPLEIVAIEVIGETLGTPRGNRYMLVISNSYKKKVKTFR